MADVFDLQAKITIDTSEYKKKIEEAKKEFDGLQDHIKNSTATISTSMNGTAQGVSGLLATFGKFASVGATIGVAGTAFAALGTVVSKTNEVVKTFGNAVKNVFEEGIKIGEKFSEVIGGSIVKSTQLAATAVKDVVSVLGGLGVDTVETGKSFESSIAQVLATRGIDKDSAGYEILKNAAKDAGRTTKFSASEAAQAENFLALAGYDEGKIADVLPSVLNLAAAGGFDLAYASDLITDAMASLSIDATKENVDIFGDKMAKAASNANYSVAQLGEAILSLGGTGASLAGGTTEEMALLGILAGRGMKGSEGGIKLRNMMLSLQSPTDKAQALMDELGLSAYSNGKLKPLNEFFGEFSRAVSGMTDEQRDNIISEIFNKVDLKAVRAMLSGYGEEYDRLFYAIENSTGAMANMAKTQSNTLDGVIKSFKSKAEAIKITIFESIESPIRDVIEVINESIVNLENSFLGGEESINGSGFFAVAIRLSDVINNIFASFTENASGIPHDIVTFIQRFFRGLKRYMPEIAENINIWITEIFGAGSGILEAILKALNDNKWSLLSIGETLIGSVMESLSTNSALLAEYVPPLISAIADSIKTNAPAFVKSVKEIITSLAEGITTIIPDLVEVGGVFISAILEIMAHSANKLSDILPVIAEKIKTLLSDGKFVVEIKKSIGSLIDSAAKILETILDFASDSKVTDPLYDIFFNICDKVLSNIDDLSPKIGDHVKTLSDNFIVYLEKNTEIGSKLADVGAKLAGEIISGLFRSIHDAITGNDSPINDLLDGNVNSSDYSERVTRWLENNRIANERAKGGTGWK